MRHWFLFFSLIIALPDISGEVYKWTSADGVTIYSDTYQSGAEKVSISVGKASQAAVEDLDPSAEGERTTTSSEAYQTFEIAQPLNDETIRSDGGMVEVGLKLSPRLSPGHFIHVYLDGTQLDTDLTTTQFSLNDLNRGTHTLQAKVVDAEGKPQISTPLMSFHLRQAPVDNP